MMLEIILPNKLRIYNSSTYIAVQISVNNNFSVTLKILKVQPCRKRVGKQDKRDRKIEQ